LPEPRPTNTGSAGFVVLEVGGARKSFRPDAWVASAPSRAAHGAVGGPRTTRHARPDAGLPRHPAADGADRPGDGECRGSAGPTQSRSDGACALALGVWPRFHSWCKTTRPPPRPPSSGAPRPSSARLADAGFDREHAGHRSGSATPRHAASFLLPCLERTPCMHRSAAVLHRQPGFR